MNRRFNNVILCLTLAIVLFLYTPIISFASDNSYAYANEYKPIKWDDNVDGSIITFDKPLSLYQKSDSNYRFEIYYLKKCPYENIKIESKDKRFVYETKQKASKEFFVRKTKDLFTGNSEVYCDVIYFMPKTNQTWFITFEQAYSAGVPFFLAFQTKYSNTWEIVDETTEQHKKMFQGFYFIRPDDSPISTEYIQSIAYATEQTSAPVIQGNEPEVKDMTDTYTTYGVLAGTALVFLIIFASRASRKRKRKEAHLRRQRNIGKANKKMQAKKIKENENLDRYLEKYRNEYIDEYDDVEYDDNEPGYSNEDDFSGYFKSDPYEDSSPFAEQTESQIASPASYPADMPQYVSFIPNDPGPAMTGVPTPRVSQPSYDPTPVYTSPYEPAYDEPQPYQKPAPLPEWARTDTSQDTSNVFF